MYLDQVSRRLPILRHFKKGDMQLLPGKLVALFDVRLQQWRAIDYIAEASRKWPGGRSRFARVGETRGPRGSQISATSVFNGLMSLSEKGYSWI